MRFSRVETRVGVQELPRGEGQRRNGRCVDGWCVDGHRKRHACGILVALVISIVAMLLSMSSARAAGAADILSPQDPNNIGAPDIEAQYQKRYPFAKAAAQADVLQNGQSQPGTTQTYEAYKFVRRLCRDDFEGGNPFFGTDVHYEQTPKIVTFSPPTKRYEELFKTGQIKTFGLPCSDSQYQLIDRECRQRLLELFFDPEHWMWTRTTAAHMQALSLANSVGGAAESNFKGAFGGVTEPLTNIANEASAAGGNIASGAKRGESQAIFIVQQMYKQIFMPMAVLLLLPGALLTQIKGMVGFGMLGLSEDATSPFEGFLRALVAVFLIPTTQLIISYSIDVGNSLAGAVSDPVSQFIQPQLIFSWAKEQTFNPPIDKVANGILPPQGGGNNGQNSANSNVATGAFQLLNGGGGGGVAGQGGAPGGFFNISFPGSGPIGQSVGNAISDFLNSVLGFFGGQNNTPGLGGQGKSAGQSELLVTAENQLFLSSALQIGFNGFAAIASIGLTVLTSYQLVFMCYLMLMGPIAACFFAWPAGCGSLFRQVFTNWLNAVVVLSLWRFYWCVILAVMTVRLIAVRPDFNSPQEMMVFSCFLTLLLYVPFHPFDFSPGEIVAEMLDKAAKGATQAAGAGAGNPIGSSPLGKGPMPLVEQRSGVASGHFARLASRGTPEGGLAPGQAKGDKGKVVADEQPKRPKANILGGLERDNKVPPLEVAMPMLAMSFDRLPPVSLMGEALTEGMSIFTNNANIQLVGAERIGILPLEPHDNPKFLSTTTNNDQVKQGVETWQRLITEAALPSPAVGSLDAPVPQASPPSGAPASQPVAPGAEAADSKAQSIKEQSQSQRLASELRRVRESWHHKHHPPGHDPEQKPPPTSGEA